MSSSFGKFLVAVVLVTFLASGFAVLGAHAASRAGSDHPFTGIGHATMLGTSPSTSDNWAGYAIKTSAGAVSDVQGSWNVPQIAVACPSSARYSSFWIGIDGDGSSTVEQIGTDTDCSGGSPSYYAWYEFYPAGSHNIAMSISPADVIHAQVSYSTSTSKFTVQLKDVTTGASFSKTAGVAKAKRASAEWIAEDPSNGLGLLKLTDYGWVTFNNATAKISGSTHPISGFPNLEITMWNTAGTAKMATPGSLQNSGKEFRVTWKSTGP